LSGRPWQIATYTSVAHSRGNDAERRYHHGEES
jgi:hypothetical protein